MSRSRDIADFVAEITDGTDTVETGYVINGSAKAWVQPICLLLRSKQITLMYHL